MLGVAWPSASKEFGQPIGSLSLILVALTVGYFSLTMTVGLITQRIGYARSMISAAVLLTIGLAGLALVPLWAGFLGAYVVIGAGAGLLDGGLNAYGAVHFRPRDLNWLHAFYGVGATIGPSIMTVIVASEASWRLGYGAVAALGMAAIVLFVAVRSRFAESGNSRPGAESAAEASKGDPPEPTPGNRHDGARLEDENAPAGRRARRGIVIGSLSLFFFYTAVEVIAGQWAYSLFTIGRGIAPAVAGPWVAGYYGALTVGRMLFGWIAERVRTRTLLQYASGGAATGVALVWIGTPDALAAVGLFLLGFSLAPMFPLLVGETPKRVGSRLSDHMVGAQIGAANIGAVLLVGATGIAVELVSLEAVGAILAICTAIFIVCNELVARAS